MSYGWGGVAEEHEEVIVKITGEDGAVGGVVGEAVGGVRKDHVDY